jgi:hypothetical protein
VLHVDFPCSVLDSPFRRWTLLSRRSHVDNQHYIVLMLSINMEIKLLL